MSQGPWQGCDRVRNVASYIYGQILNPRDAPAGALGTNSQLTSVT